MVKVGIGLTLGQCDWCGWCSKRVVMGLAQYAWGWRFGYYLLFDCWWPKNLMMYMYHKLVSRNNCVWIGTRDIRLTSGEKLLLYTHRLGKIWATQRQKPHRIGTHSMSCPKYKQGGYVVKKIMENATFSESPISHFFHCCFSSYLLWSIVSFHRNRNQSHLQQLATTSFASNTVLLFQINSSMHILLSQLQIVWTILSMRRSFFPRRLLQTGQSH